MKRPMVDSRCALQEVAGTALLLAVCLCCSMVEQTLALEGDRPRDVAVMRQWVDAVFENALQPKEEHDRLVVLRRSHKILRRCTVWDTPLQLGQQVFPHGLFMDAPAAVQVRLTRPAKSFSAIVGIDNNRSTQGNPDAGSARFHIEVAGKSEFSTPVLRLRDEPTRIQVSLEGALEFVLRVDDGGNGRGWDQCSWADALVTFADGTECYLDELPIEPPESIAPFSFVLDGRSCTAFLKQCKRSHSRQRLDDKTIETYCYQDPDSGLAFECVVTVYDDEPAVDWICYVENRGQQASPIVENLLPVNVDLAGLSEQTAVTLRWSQGDNNCAEAFLPHDDPLGSGESRRFSPHGGRSSNGAGGGVLPFFNVHGGNIGWIVAVGWSGQWKAEFSRDASGRLSFLAGMEHTRFRLSPGERVRTPRVVLLRYEDDEMIAGHNAFRQLVLRHYWQQEDGKPAIPPVCHNTAATVYRSGKEATEANQRTIIAKAAELGCEAYWMDAYWYPRPWHTNVGNWFPRPDDFPHGLKPLGEASHVAAMKFVLWFEPERVWPGTAFDRDHSKFLIELDDSGNRLFNLADPVARRWLTDFLDERIKRWDVDIYRNDFNFDPLPFWLANDRAEGVGLTEIRYVEGLYRIWDELRERNPGLTIDNCASGGRRIDLELCSRSYPLWRSDFNDIGEGLKGEAYWPQMGRASQVHVGGLSLYLPIHAGPLWSMEPYNVRSCMSGTVVLYDRILKDGFPEELARQGIADVKELRPYFLGDYYPLLELTPDQSDWWAYQLDRPDLQEGIVLAFRRPESEETKAVVQLRGIDGDSGYEVSVTGESYEQTPYRVMRGEMLQELEITIPKQPGSALIRYRRAGRDGASVGLSSEK